MVSENKTTLMILEFAVHFMFKMCTCISLESSLILLDTDQTMVVQMKTFCHTAILTPIMCSTVNWLTALKCEVILLQGDWQVPPPSRHCCQGSSSSTSKAFPGKFLCVYSKAWIVA